MLQTEDKCLGLLTPVPTPFAGPDCILRGLRGSILSTPVTHVFNFCTLVGELCFKAVFLNLFKIIIP